MDIEDFNIPDHGYELVRNIKQLDGRVEFIDEWVKAINDRILNANPKLYDGQEFDTDKGKRRLRIVRPTSGVTVHTPKYKEIVKSLPNDVLRRTVEVIPPKYPRSFRIEAPLPNKRALEWTEIAAQGMRMEKTHYGNGRDTWTQMSARKIAEGLLYLKGRKAQLCKEKDEFRDRLAEMIEAEKWGDSLLGRYDGRLNMRPAQPRYSLLITPEEFRRRYPSYVNTYRRMANPTVGFYVVQEDDE